ncbi:MAG TPA: AbrB/MazE/SpoVT family DNA-binding domain-containing protein [Anaerolineales bacterium]|nr:AbrB/MazE/SpoVT family DNA-binding domain-containing protein [Anaerolineales bacterium]
MEFKVQVYSGGRFVLPLKLRKELQIKAGDEIVLSLEDGSVRLIPLHQAIRIAQQTIKKYVPERTSLAADLIKARKEEAAYE